MNKKLEEISWYQGKFRRTNGRWVSAKPLSGPISITIEEIDNYVGKVLPYKNLDINAYCKGTPSVNQRGYPIQFYKIKSK